MIRTLTLSLASALLLTAGTPALARGDRDRDQENLREAAAQGKVIPLGRLIAEVRSHPPYRDMTYLGGPRFIAERMVYALKFMDGNQVVVVYVDARTGRIVGRKP
ncbi:PepSY domain-containing protein [Sphingopyxis panaciterrulae]|uniref:Putative iron-regulated membrane protein n=1 Tax=Sphingopyxis panaciterrulae TaxID=462372 RepID=A0A7W9B4R6_9SPHN|nr:PepSY domain-containing protein [Sphingopyxis panaciterrulae]MBB5706269.1 putative iron-regulated membrane protein [Sphingopyxis panaciterrulae]